jgi:putative ABC transport system substrate-binding protein
MIRREFMTLLGSAAAWPVEALAQVTVNPVRIGFLPIGSSSNAFDRSLVEAFREGLRAVGLVENQHVIIDVTWVGIESEFPQAVSELLKRGNCW